MASSSVASSVSSACVSTVPTGTGRASRGDSSADPVSSEAESSSAGRSTGISGCCQVSPHGDFNAHPQLQQGGEREGLSQRRVKGSTRVGSFGPRSGRHAGASTIRNIFGVHSHHDQWVVFSTFFFWPKSRAPLHLRGLEARCSMAVTRSGRIWTGR